MRVSWSSRCISADVVRRVSFACRRHFSFFVVFNIYQRDFLVFDARASLVTRLLLGKIQDGGRSEEICFIRVFGEYMPFSYLRSDT
jgi:hypothetical protein